MALRTEFASALNQAASERGLDAEEIVGIIKEAVKAAYRKTYGTTSVEEEDDGLEVEIPVKVAKGGSAAYAAISSQKIAETLQKLGYDIDKKWVELKEPIKKIGEYKIKINLPHDLEAEITAAIVSEGGADQAGKKEERGN